MQVEIKINNLQSSTTIKAVENNAFISVNNNRINYDANKFLKKLLPIINTWDTDSRNLMIKDAESYQIIIIDNNQRSVLNGKSYSHPNYREFKKLIREVL